jgi:hypothetical protein
VNVGKLRNGQDVRMTDWNDLTPTEQRQVLADQMRISRGHHLMAQSHSVEALARSRELLAVPVYCTPSLGGEQSLKAGTKR